jgi:late competence protein required for DNA uptake (superfamily II DNA/RNA helicase)
VMNPQNNKIHNLIVSNLKKKKNHLDVVFIFNHKIYYKEKSSATFQRFGLYELSEFGLPMIEVEHHVS